MNYKILSYICLIVCVILDTIAVVSTNLKIGFIITGAVAFALLAGICLIENIKQKIRKV